MDNKGQVAIEWLILLGAILILTSVILYTIEAQTKINTAKDIQSTKTIKDKIYKM